MQALYVGKSHGFVRWRHRRAIARLRQFSFLPMILRGKVRRITIEKSLLADSEGNLLLTHGDINLARRESYQQWLRILDVLRRSHDGRVGALHDRVTAAQCRRR